MKVVGISEKEFRQRFRTEAQCARYLMTRKYPEGVRCKHCDPDRFYLRQKRFMYECRRCGYQESPKAHTLFHGSNVSLRDWFWAIHLFTVSKGGISALELQRRLGFGSYKTAGYLLHKLRSAMQKRDGQYRLGGLIELDTAYFGKRASHNQGAVFIAVENRGQRAGFAKVQQVSTASRTTAQRFAQQALGSSSLVNTDGGFEFRSLHQVGVEHDYQIADSVEVYQSWMPWVHKLISNLKACLTGTYHGVRTKYLHLYLAEYLFRFNRRQWLGELFNRTLTAALSTGQIRYADVSA